MMERRRPRICPPQFSVPLATGEVPFPVTANSLKVCAFWFGPDFHSVRPDGTKRQDHRWLLLHVRKAQPSESPAIGVSLSEETGRQEPLQISLNPDRTCLDHHSQADCYGDSLCSSLLEVGVGGVGPGLQGHTCSMGLSSAAAPTASQPQGLDVTSVTTT